MNNNLFIYGNTFFIYIKSNTSKNHKIVLIKKSQGKCNRINKNFNKIQKCYSVSNKKIRMILNNISIVHEFVFFGSTYRLFQKKVHKRK